MRLQLIQYLLGLLRGEGDDGRPAALPHSCTHARVQGAAVSDGRMCGQRYNQLPLPVLLPVEKESDVVAVALLL